MPRRLAFCAFLALTLLLVGTAKLPAAAASHPEPAPSGDTGSSYSFGEEPASSQEKAFRLTTSPGLLTPLESTELSLSESSARALPGGRDFRVLSMVHEEDKISLFSAVAEVGSGAEPIRFVFPEGAPYRLSVAGLTGPPRTDRFDIDVAGLAPDRRAQIRAGLLLLFVYLLGAAGGAGLARLRRAAR